MLNAVTHIHSCELPCAMLALCCWPESCSNAAEGVCCLSHLDRSCWETGGKMLFMSFPVKISLHSGWWGFYSQVVLIPTTCTEGQVRTLVGTVTSWSEMIHQLKSQIAFSIMLSSPSGHFISDFHMWDLIIRADILSLFSSSRINVENLYVLSRRPVLYKTVNEMLR